MKVDGEEIKKVEYDDNTTLIELFNKGWDFFWSQNELKYDKNLNIVRSDTPRVLPRVWFQHINNK